MGCCVYQRGSITDSPGMCCAMLCAQVGLAPHVYPRSITGAPQVMPDELQEMVLRWDLSWGFKMRGEDRLSDVSMQGHGLQSHLYGVLAGA